MPEITSTTTLPLHWKRALLGGGYGGLLVKEALLVDSIITGLAREGWVIVDVVGREMHTDLFHLYAADNMGNSYEGCPRDGYVIDYTIKKRG
jgi:hypothetical protein